MGAEIRRRRTSLTSEMQPESAVVVKRVLQLVELQNLGPPSWRLVWLQCSKFCYFLLYLFSLVLSFLVLRKTIFTVSAVRYVKDTSHQTSAETISQSPHFMQLLKTLDADFSRPPAIFLLNQHALNMTFNFLCSTQDLEGAHDRFIFVTLDSVASDVLNEYWPKVRQIYWDTPSLYQPFSFAESAYQALYFLRASLAVSLLERGKSFWMMQQDTFWRNNFFDLMLEDNYEYDALFDQIGDGKDSKRAEWINGANFFVRANNDTLRFFKALARKLNDWYAPDMGIMIQQCQTWSKPKCAYIPHRIAHSWEWMFTDQKNPPYIIQLDCETNGGSKLMELAKYGFYFMNSDNHRICNRSAVDVARQRMNDGKIEARRTPGSWGRFQFKVYWKIVDYILSTPVVGSFVKPYLPVLGYMLMITI